MAKRPIGPLVEIQAEIDLANAKRAYPVVVRAHHCVSERAGRLDPGRPAGFGVVAGTTSDTRGAEPIIVGDVRERARH